MAPWRNAYALVFETRAFGIESASLSGPPNFSFFDMREVPVIGRRAVLKTVDWRRASGVRLFYLPP